MTGPPDDQLIAALGSGREGRSSLCDHATLIRVASTMTLLALWEAYGRGVDPLLFTYPSAVARAALDLVTSGELLRQLPMSLAVLGAGFAASVVLGVSTGLVVGRSRLLEAVLEPHVNALSAMPPVALIPLLMMWFGLGFGVKAVTVFLFAFFPVLVNTVSGAKQVAGSMLDVARVVGASERQVLVKIVLPAALPFVMAGVRLAVGRALVGTIVAELFTALTGLGAMLTFYGNTFATAHVFAVVVLVAAIGVGLARAAQVLEGRLTRWKDTERAIR